MELVKNAYDADADWVKVSIFLDGEDDRIEIEDNGFGMDYTAIERGWLFISISSKRDMKAKAELSPRGRAPLGEKGLGRLSTQKLGYQLEMTTGKIGESTQHTVSFDWKDFDGKTELSKVLIAYEATEKSSLKSGTKLTIKNLRNKSIWDETGILAFRAQLSQLIFPYKDKRPFEVYLFRNSQPLDLDEINENLRKTAIGRFSFSFDRKTLRLNGNIKLAKFRRGNIKDSIQEYETKLLPDSGADFYQFLTDEIRNKSNHIPFVKFEGKQGVFISFEKEYDFYTLGGRKSVVNETGTQIESANPGAFSGEIDEYHLVEDEDTEIYFPVKGDYKTFIKNQIGVRIFRDGFGIKPYGLPQNDWLGLNKGQTSGSSFYGLRPGNVIGFIQISVYENINLLEKTDREGFQETPYSKNFFLLINRIIDDINDIYERVRRSWNDYRKFQAAEKGGISNYKDSTKRLKEAAQLANQMDTPFAKLSLDIEQTTLKVTNIIEQTRSEPLFMSEADRKLSPLLQDIEGLLSEAKQILKDVGTLLPLAKKLEQDAAYLEPQIQSLEEQILQFSELAGLGLTAEALTHEIYNILDRISSQTESISKKLKSSSVADPSFFIYVESVKTFLKNIRSQVNHLSPSLKYNREKIHEIRLSNFATELEVHYQARFESQQIEFKIEVQNDFVILANLGKITQIFDNLVLNSEYWLKERQKNHPDFKANITFQIIEPLVRIFDNGYGVSTEIESQIFQPFVTTKPRSIGRGLGLFITQQLMESLGCEINLLQNKNTENRRHVFQLNFESITK